MFAVALFAILVEVRATDAGSALPPPPESNEPRTVVLTAPQMFRLAAIASSKGDLKTASAIYTALERNPNADIRAEARFRHAKQLLAEKRNRDAALLLRRLVDDKPGATAARLELAHTLQLLGDPDAALRELRAVSSRGLPLSVVRLIDRYSEALRATQTAGASIEIALAPDSNINRATRSDTLGTIFGDFSIDPKNRAKSGIGLAVRWQAFRRLRLGTADNSFLVRVSGLGNLYRNATFNDVAADLGAGPELRLGRNQLNLELGATQRSSGQKPIIRSVRAGATWARPLGSRTQLRLTASASLIDNRLNDLEDGKEFFGRMEVERALSETTGAGLNLSADRQTLADPGYSTTGLRAGLVGWKDVGRMTVTAELEIGKLRADERLLLFPEKRSESYSRLSIGMTFRQLQWHGFAPLARFTIERNLSTIQFYDYRRTRGEVGLVRAF